MKLFAGGSGMVARLLTVLAVICVVSQGVYAQELENLPAGHWAKISLNTVSDVDPCPNGGCSYSASSGQKAVMNEWSGGAFATRYGTKGGYIVFGGGHKGYYGNEVYVFDIDTLRWNRVSEPVTNPTCNQSTGELQDGSPCSAHTYDYTDYHPASNSFVLLGSASNHDVGGGGVSRVHLFSLDTSTWRTGADNLSGFESGTGASSGYDPNRDVFWLLSAFNAPFAKYDPSANGGNGNWTPYNRYSIDIDGVSAIDPVHDLFVTLDTRYRRIVHVHDLSNPSSAGVVVNTTGDTALQAAGSHGFEWDPVSQKFVGWAGGSTVYTLTPPSGNWRTGDWVWRRVDPAPDNSVVPDSPNSNGTYSRWQYVPSLNAFIVVNRTNSAVYLYKLSEGGGSTIDTTAPLQPTGLIVQ